ncbi:MAG: kynureninase [Phycisphaerae bacterium]|nr:kynureninase [Phycisphaerae bacterium]
MSARASIASLEEAHVGAFEAGEAFARHLDSIDPLRGLAEEFLHPPGPFDGRRLYFCGHSLGLQPRRTRSILEEELEEWATLGVEGHRKARRPWFDYHLHAREGLARVVGAKPEEVVAMNGLTTNLHLLMLSFHRPSGARRRLLMEKPAFPSDTYAVKTHLRARGLDPSDLVEVSPREGEEGLRTEDLVAAIEREGEALSSVMLAGVDFLTGTRLDVEAVTRAAHRVGATAGFDLAHAAGNVPLRLHDWGADWAAWCHYKYMNSGPGAIAGAFVHERHAETNLPRFAGWWGNEPATRFRMQLIPEFHPVAGADGWQLSNPPILALAPLLASLELFDRAGMDRLRAKSRVLTGYLHWLLRERRGDEVMVVTPTDPERRGAQLSLRFPRVDARAVVMTLRSAGAVVDFREPDLIRVAPTALYNSFLDAWRLVEILGPALRGAHAVEVVGGFH